MSHSSPVVLCTVIVLVVTALTVPVIETICANAMLLRATLPATMRLSSIFVFILPLNARPRREGKLFGQCGLALDRHSHGRRNGLATNKTPAG